MAQFSYERASKQAGVPSHRTNDIISSPFRWFLQCLAADEISFSLFIELRTSFVSHKATTRVNGNRGTLLSDPPPRQVSSRLCIYLNAVCLLLIVRLASAFAFAFDFSISKEITDIDSRWAEATCSFFPSLSLSLSLFLCQLIDRLVSLEITSSTLLAKKIIVCEDYWTRKLPLDQLHSSLVVVWTSQQKRGSFACR